jgi:uncharacterized protein (DUF362 family)/Pyruvate/2-oxoacid:ferredoxin oxidoreductase delta subunit
MPLVALEKCVSYEGDAVKKAVADAVSACLGGDVDAVRGQTVLLKPNLLAAREPARGVTTHPAVVGAAIDLFQDLGAIVSVGDSPAGAVRGVRRVWENTGMLELCEQKGVPLVNFEAGGSVARQAGGKSYPISKAVLEFDRIVSIPKLKTHVLTLLTASVKNMFGCVPGFQKSALHLSYPRPEGMSRAIVDVFTLVRPWVTIVDAIDAMEGNGPSSGRPVRLGLIAAATDCVALDATLSTIIGLDPLRVPTTREAVRRGLGEATIGRITYPGLRPGEAAARGFAVPGNWKFLLIPSFLGRLLERIVWVKPVISLELCTGCGDCARVCAAGAMEVRRGKASVDDKRCVSCMCCHEACGFGAVDTRMSRLARLIA